MTTQPSSPADWRCLLCNQAAEPDAFGRLTHLCPVKPSEWIKDRAKRHIKEIKDDDPFAEPSAVVCLLQAILDYLDATHP